MINEYHDALLFRPKALSYSKDPLPSRRPRLHVWCWIEQRAVRPFSLPLLSREWRNGVEL